MAWYVNAYAVTRHYGGPEEGGWWYDAGEVVASTYIGNDYGVAERVRDKMRKRLAPRFDNTRNRYSVLGGADLVVCVEDEPAVAYPAERPYYE